MFQRIAATGTEIGAPRQLQAPGTASIGDPQVAVVRRQRLRRLDPGLVRASPEAHAVVAASHDGGRTFEPAGDRRPPDRRRRVGPRARRRRRQRLRRLHRRPRPPLDGGQPRRRPHLPVPGDGHAPGDGVDGGGVYDVAVDGDHVHWTWLATTATSSPPLDGRRAHARAGRRAPRPPALRLPGRADASPPTAASSRSPTASSSRCRARTARAPTSAAEPASAAPRTAARRGPSTHDRRRRPTAASATTARRPTASTSTAATSTSAGAAQGPMWLAHSRDGGAGFAGADAARPLPLHLAHPAAPYVAAHGDTVVATWHSAPDPGSCDMDPVAAFSSDRGRTFTLRTVDDRRGPGPRSRSPPPGARTRRAPASPGVVRASRATAATRT